MSRFTSQDINSISPYVPGEQPRDKSYIKLNTNENPYFTSWVAAMSVDREVLRNLKRYSDPECTSLTSAIASYYGVGQDNVLVTNGSDEALAFTFYAYCRSGVCFPDVTYGFYEVIANLFGCPYEKIPLDGNFRYSAADYAAKGRTIVLANPNAQTGIDVGIDCLEEIIRSNSANIVVLDQAYSDFGDTDVIPLVAKYDNLVVVNTFSKSRSLAGARVGYIIADSGLIEDIKKVKNSFHPYNVNSLSAILAEKALGDEEYFKECVGSIKATKSSLSKQLIELGFEVLPSSANFVLARHPAISGEELYLKLKEMGVLVRHFGDERIADYIRITVGTDDETGELLARIARILNDRGQLI